MSEQDTHNDKSLLLGESESIFLSSSQKRMKMLLLLIDLVLTLSLAVLYSMLSMVFSKTILYYNIYIYATDYVGHVSYNAFLT